MFFRSAFRFVFTDCFRSFTVTVLVFNINITKIADFVPSITFTKFSYLGRAFWVFWIAFELFISVACTVVEIPIHTVHAIIATSPAARAIRCLIANSPMTTPIWLPSLDPSAILQAPDHRGNGRGGRRANVHVPSKDGGKPVSQAAPSDGA